MRFLGVNIPDSKAVKIGLTYIYGIGYTTARQICSKCGVGVDTKVSALTQDQINSMMSYIKDNIVFEGELRKNVALSIKYLMDIKCYRGARHRANLPVRGQRTHTNARTRKGRSRVPIAGKKKV